MKQERQESFLKGLQIKNPVLKQGDGSHVCHFIESIKRVAQGVIHGREVAYVGCWNPKNL